MTSKANRESTNGIVSTNKFISDANSKDFTRGQAQIIISINTEIFLNNKRNNFDFDFTDLKIGRQFNYQNQHCEATSDVMDIINKRKKSPQTHRFFAERQEITQPGNLRMKFDCNLHRKVSVLRRPHK